MFSTKLQSVLKSKSPHGKMEVINLAVIGFSSYQGLKLYDIFARTLKPDLVVVWFGFNDMLYYHLPDREAVSKSRLIYRVQSLLSHTQTYHFLRQVLFDLSRPSDKPKSVGQRNSRRVPLQEYENYLNQIIANAQSDGADVIVMTTPVRPSIPLILNAVAVTYKDEDGTIYEKLQAQYELDGYWLMDARRFPGSESELDRLIDKYPQMPILHYFKSEFARQNGDIVTAKREKQLSDSLDKDRETVDQYNELLHKISQETGATLIDLVPLFHAHEDTDLFVDDCHPNPAGHALITQTLVEYIDQNLIRSLEYDPVTPDIVER